VSELSKVSCATRDTAIQIFDSFLSRCLQDGKHGDIYCLSNVFVSHAATSSILLSCKLHECKKLLSMSSFPDFRVDDLVNFEMEVLLVVGFDICPPNTPTSFVQRFLHIWTDNLPLIEKIADTAEILLAEFWEDCLESVVFAPSTIAIAAILISFSILQMDCKSWLDCLPDSCLSPPSPSVSVCHWLAFDSLNVDKCLSRFHQLDCVRKHFQSKSPTSVYETHVAMSPTPGMHPHCGSSSTSCNRLSSPTKSLQGTGHTTSSCDQGAPSVVHSVSRDERDDSCSVAIDVDAIERDGIYSQLV